jgi:HPt (histidine-containing phosphotransfer) domain-containing protein
MDTGEHQKVSDLSHLVRSVGGNNAVIKEIIELFCEQMPADLQSLNEAIRLANYPKIRSCSHKMRCSFTLMGVTGLSALLETMEKLGEAGQGIDKIEALAEEVYSISALAIKEIQTEKEKYT